MRCAADPTQTTLPSSMGLDLIFAHSSYIAERLASVRMTMLAGRALAGLRLCPGDRTPAREGPILRAFRAVPDLSLANPLRSVALAVVLSLGDSRWFRS